MWLAWFQRGWIGWARLAVASTCWPSGIHQVLRALRRVADTRKSSGPQDTWRTSQTRARFRRLGRFPAPSCETSTSIFLGPRVGWFTAESVRNLTLRMAFRAGTGPCPGTAPCAGTATRRNRHASEPPLRGNRPVPRPRRTDQASLAGRARLPAPPRRESGQISPNPPIHGGSYLRARWATQILSTPPNHGGRVRFCRDDATYARRRPSFLLPRVGRFSAPTSWPTSAAGGGCQVAHTTPETPHCLAHTASRPALLDSRRPTALPRATPRYPALPRATPRYPALPRATPRYPALPRATPRYPALPRATPRYPALPRPTPLSPRLAALRHSRRVSPRYATLAASRRPTPLSPPLAARRYSRHLTADDRPRYPTPNPTPTPHPPTETAGEPQKAAIYAAVLSRRSWPARPPSGPGSDARRRD